MKLLLLSFDFAINQPSGVKKITPNKFSDIFALTSIGYIMIIKKI
jgi:hypothetical protein